MNEDGLVAVDLTRVYRSGHDEVRAVDRAHMRVAHGELVAVVGPSGSGKTTLLAMLGALLRPTAGRVVVDGIDVTALSEPERARFRRNRIGFVFQNYNLVPYLTARENLLAVADIAGRLDREARRTADRLLDELGLSGRANFLPGELSGGERQRVAIARALMNDPALVLVDEPTSNLDVRRGREVVEALQREVVSRRKIGVMVTHDLRMLDHVSAAYLLEDGRLSSRETAEEAAREMLGEVTRR
jgi:putative ABC transport system ATP-binding protein